LVGGAIEWKRGWRAHEQCAEAVGPAETPERRHHLGGGTGHGVHGDSVGKRGGPPLSRPRDVEPGPDLETVADLGRLRDDRAAVERRPPRPEPDDLTADLEID